MIVSLIAAISDNNVIGQDGKLPWRLPDDLQHFHNLTLRHPVIMGRKTYESIPEKHRPLPDRVNIVITRQNVSFPGCTVVHSMEDALEKIRGMKSEIRNNREVFVIGGAEIYRQALSLAQRMYLTRVHANIAGDVLFPEVRWGEWREIAREEHPADTRHAYALTYVVYTRVLC